MQLNPYVIYDGQCEAAFRLYERCLGGKLEMLTHAESPMADQAPAGWGKKIMHARLEVDGWVLMGSDAPPGHHETPQGFSVTLGVDSPAEAERVFNGLAEGGTVRMPLQKTFWAASFGMLVDRFGTPWMINCEGGA
jgi:PhnB protein